MRGFPWWIPVVLAGCVGKTDGGSGPPDGAPGYEPVKPGTCQGTATPCELPPAQDFDALLAEVPLFSCNEESGQAGRIQWKAPMGQVECPVGMCDVNVDRVFAAEDGSVWIQGNLQPPGVAWGATVGTALLRFDARGQRSFGITVDARSRLAGTTPFTYRMKSGKDGTLLWLAPMGSDPGVELREYDTSGRVAHRWPLSLTTNTAGGAILGPGSVVLNYTYDRTLAGLPDAGTDDERRDEYDIARFDAPGGMVWNFTATGAFGPGLTRLGSATSDDGVLLFGSVVPKYEAERFVMARLGLDGRVVARFESAAFRLQFSQPTASGATLLSLVGGSPIDSQMVDVAVDSGGKLLWQVRAHSFFQISTGWATDEQGRAWSADYSGDGLVMGVLGADGARCVSFPVDVQVCTPSPDGNGKTCGGFDWAVGKGGSVFLTQHGTVSLVHFEGLP